MQSIITKHWRASSGPAFVVVVTLSVPVAVVAQLPANATTPAQTLDEVAARVASGAWDTFSTDVTVRRRLVAANGEATGPAPATERFRWQRTKTPTGWKSTTTRTLVPRATVQSRQGAVTLDSPPSVAKIEDAEDGSAIRVWDSRGVEIPLPPADLRELAGAAASSMLDRAPQSAGAGASFRSRDWIEGFVMPVTARARRRATFERQMAGPVKTASGVKQYTRRDGLVEREWLVDDQEGVLLEANVVDDGALVEHTTFSYDRTTAGAVVKRGIRHERLLSRDTGTRTVTEIEYSDIRVTSEGGR